MRVVERITSIEDREFIASRVESQAEFARLEGRVFERQGEERLQPFGFTAELAVSPAGHTD
jgi:hypothetical protein